MRRRTMLRALAAGLPLLAGSVRAQSSGAHDSIVTTATGKWRGRSVNGIHIFKGIRYGADTSRRRFLSPVAPEPWTGVRDALEFGPIAPQTGNSGRAMSEDCLHLNVWTPGLRDNAKRPVMVWF